MNKLSPEKQSLIISALVEGNSIRSVERMTGSHRDTIMRLGVRVGEACTAMMDERIRDVESKRLQLDEIWCYVGKKQRHATKDDNPSEVGDHWTWVAIDADTKLVPSFRVSKRDLLSAHQFVSDLRSRIKTNRVQISADKLPHYVSAISREFPDADFGQIVKSYEAEPIGPGRYSPPKVTSVGKTVVMGSPDAAHVSTSYVERQNLTMRMQMRRFTRLTNGFSKKSRNLRAAVGLHFAHYNYVRRHESLKTTPAIASELETRRWTVRDLVDLAN